MGEVFLDGEKVDFQGAPPASIGAAWEAVGNYLAEQQRVSAETRVDGDLWDPDADADREEWGRLEIRSIDLETKLIQLAREWEGRRRAMRERIEALAGDALVCGWNEARAKIFAVFDELRPLVEQYGALASLGEAKAKPWAASVIERYGACGEALQVTSQAVEAEDCVVLSDRLVDALAPAVDALIAESARSLELERRENSAG